MKVAITGGTGFVGRNIARSLTDEGHEVVLIARGLDRTDLSARTRLRTRFVSLDFENEGELAKAVAECDAMPTELAPRLRFTPEQIRKGLPKPGPFSWRDLSCTGQHRGADHRHSKRVFFEMP